MSNPLAADLERVVTRTAPLWEELRGGRLFVTGGTGFFGCWLLESFLWANERLGLAAEAVVLTRDPAAFVAKAPRLAAHPAVTLQRGDVRSFDFPAGEFSHVIHAAADEVATANSYGRSRTLDVIVSGTSRALEFAAACGAVKFLLISSGAVYGRQPTGVSHVGEEHAGAPDTCDAASAYGEGKRVSELLCALAASEKGLQAKIARCFAFVGPYLPLNGRYAVGNFLGDHLARRAVRVSGDGTAVRSYMYAADLAVWLWTILFRGAPGRAYNVGSEREVNIAELAHMVAAMETPRLEVRVEGKAGDGASCYVPSTARARRELGLAEEIGLEEALRRTSAWHTHVAGRGEVLNAAI